MSNEVDFSEAEEQDINEAKQQKMIWFGDPKLSFKRRLYQFIATVVTNLLMLFTTRLKWQFGLVIYLCIVCPVGTYVSLKWIYNLFF